MSIRPASLWLALSVQWDECSVALAADDPIDAPIDELRVRDAAHASRQALAMIDRLLQARASSLAEVAGLCFARGPGAFTSLRVAAGLVQGLALALDRPVAGICSLAALAAGSARWRAAGSEGEWLQLAALDARMGEVYYGVQRCAPGRYPVTVAAPAVGDAAAAIACFERTAAATALPLECAGSGFAALAALADWGRVHAATLAADRAPWARSVLALARSGGAPVAGPAATAQPVYVRDKIALDVAEQAAARAARAAGAVPSRLAGSAAPESAAASE
ncbi:MAG: tRNA (adenosine(37)-N6)-threonylcarbamoyltransferase complex dimerization subunit type 1 TsaB [Lautropia sp.]